MTVSPEAQKMGTDAIEWANSDTVANVYNVEQIEVYLVLRKFRDEQAENLPMLCSECFHEWKIKGFSHPTEDIGVI